MKEVKAIHRYMQTDTPILSTIRKKEKEWNEKRGKGEASGRITLRSQTLLILRKLKMEYGFPSPLQERNLLVEITETSAKFYSRKKALQRTGQTTVLSHKL